MGGRNSKTTLEITGFEEVHITQFHILSTWRESDQWHCCFCRASTFKQLVINHSLCLKKKKKTRRETENKISRKRSSILSEAGSTLSSINCRGKYSCQHSGHILHFIHQLCNCVFQKFLFVCLLFLLVSAHDIVGLSVRECWQENSQ